jgi:predicted lipoprotein
MGGSIQRFRAAVYAVAGARKGGPTQLHEGQHGISARNRLQGKIVEVTKGATTAYVKIDVGGANA